jgi:hypothetical protein
VKRVSKKGRREGTKEKEKNKREKMWMDRLVVEEK